MIRKSIVVPCFNEAENLPSLIDSFAGVRGTDADWELVLVDNGSTDATRVTLLKELELPGREFIRVVSIDPPNIGYGHGIMTGLRSCASGLLAFTHADGQTPPADVLAGFELLASSARPDRTLVKGRRRGRPVKDAAFTLGMQAAALVLLGPGFADVNAQPKVFPRALFELATHPPDDLSLDLYLLWLARKHGFSLRTFNVHFGERLHGKSRWAFNWRSKARNIARTVRFMGQLRRAR